MSLMDLWKPVLPKRAIPKVYLLEPSKKEARKAYEREYHLKNRARRIAAMKARYETNKQEYIERANEWRAKNPEKSRQIKRNSKLRIKRKAALC